MRYRKLQKVLVLLAFILGLFGLGLSSCHKENQELVLVKQENTLKTQSFKSPKLSDAEIIQKAQKYYKDFYGSELRGSQAPKVKKIIRSSEQSKFRSFTTDYLSKSQLLIVNFEDEKGFALMSENRYGTPLFGVSNKGNISLEKPTNTGLDIIIHNAIVITQMENKTCPKCGGPYASNLNPVIPEPNPDPNNPFIDGSNPKGNGNIQRGPVCTPFICLNDKPNDGTKPWIKGLDTTNNTLTMDIDTLGIDSIKYQHVIYESEKPILLFPEGLQWNQWSPYNNRIPLDKDGKECPVGCVAVALGQIMAYHKYPNYNWDIIYQGDTSNAYFRDVVPSFLYQLGKKEFLNMDYKSKGSGALSDSVPSTLRKFGYISSDLEDYNAEDIARNISEELPVYIKGRSTKVIIQTDTAYYKGHAWVIDGLKLNICKDVYQKIYHIRKGDQYTASYKTINESSPYNVFFFHCNFGFEKSANMFCLDKVFNIDKIEVEKEVKGDTISYKGDYFYRYKLGIVKDIMLWDENQN